MKFKNYFILLLTLPLVAFTVHKYYISLCEIEYIEEQQAVQITMGLFINDIEFTLNRELDSVVNLATKYEVKNIDAIYKNYLNEHFNIEINNEQRQYTYIGKEYDGDIVRFYLEIANIKEITSMQVTNTSLFKDFENQQNIIKIKAYGKNKTLYLNRENVKGLLNF